MGTAVVASSLEALSSFTRGGIFSPMSGVSAKARIAWLWCGHTPRNRKHFGEVLLDRRHLGFGLADLVLLRISLDRRFRPP